MYTGLSAVIGSWKIIDTTRPRIERSARASRPTTWVVPTRTEPRTEAFIGSRPINAKAIVDLPDPDSPTIAITSPARRSNDTCLTAGYQVPSTQKSMSRSRTATTVSASIRSAAGLLTGVSRHRRPLRRCAAGTMAA